MWIWNSPKLGGVQVSGLFLSIIKIVSIYKTQIQIWIQAVSSNLCVRVFRLWPGWDGDCKIRQMVTKEYLNFLNIMINVTILGIVLQQFYIPIYPFPCISFIFFFLAVVYIAFPFQITHWGKRGRSLLDKIIPNAAVLALTRGL